MIGPPKSIDIIAPKINPATAANAKLFSLDAANLLNVHSKPSPIYENGTLNKNIIRPIPKTPPNGYINVARIPSKLSGIFSVTFLSNNTKYPAAKPAKIAPINPGAAFICTPKHNVAILNFAFVARIPPAKPTTSPGLSAIEYAIYIAKIGKNIANAASPIVLNNCATLVIFPKFSTGVRPISHKNAIAFNIPPPMIKGNMCDTPLIKCLYSCLPKLSFSVDTFSAVYPLLA